MTGLLNREKKFDKQGEEDSFENWAFKIIQENLGELGNDTGTSFLKRMMSMGTVRGLQARRSKTSTGESVPGRGSLYPAMVVKNLGGMIPGVPGLHKGALFLGMPHPFKSLTRSNEIKETLARTNILAQSGRSLDFPLMQTGSRVSGLGGRSSNIPGNGIYDMKDGRYVLKFHDTLESTLTEAAASSLTRNVS